MNGDDVWHVVTALVDDNYKYYKLGKGAGPDDLLVSRLMGAAETLVADTGCEAWDHGVVSGFAYALGTALIPGLAGGRNGMRFTHAVLARDGLDPQLLETVIRNAYKSGMIEYAYRFYQQVGAGVHPDDLIRERVDGVVSSVPVSMPNSFPQTVMSDPEPANAMKGQRSISKSTRSNLGSATDGKGVESDLAQRLLVARVFCGAFLGALLGALLGVVIVYLAFGRFDLRFHSEWFRLRQ